MLTLFSIFTFLLSLFGYNPDKQLNDPKAKVLLDAVSKTYKNYESVEANFTLISTNPQQNKSSN